MPGANLGRMNQHNERTAHPTNGVELTACPHHHRSRSVLALNDIIYIYIYNTTSNRLRSGYNSGWNDYKQSGTSRQQEYLRLTTVLIWSPKI